MIRAGITRDCGRLPVRGARARSPRPSAPARSPRRDRGGRWS